MARYCMRLLERLGYHVMAYKDPRAALALFRKHPGNCDLEITDMTMPGQTQRRLFGFVIRVLTRLLDFLHW